MNISLFLLIIYCSTCASRALERKGYRWGTWSPLPLGCSVTCGFGLRCRVRKCLNVHGVAQPTNAPCISPEDHGPKSQSCVTCVVNVRCPRAPGWSNWGPWSSCRATRTNDTERRGSCLMGIKARYRRCDNPPPKPEPYGMSCVGSNRDVKTCFYGCSKLPDTKPLDVSKRIHLRIEADHRLVRYPYQVVLRKLSGEKVTMSCETDAYKLAKRITVAKAFNAANKSFTGKTISIAWYRNGRLVQDSEAETSLHQRRLFQKFRTWSDRYLDEEIRWNELTRPSKFQLEDQLLVIPSIDEGDQGFYTCELRYEEYRWLAAFYSLIVIGVRYAAQATDPFYLHSNLGFSNALRRAPVWLESAQIVWQLNGVEQSRGLAVRLARRIQKIEHLNHTHQGTWLCFLVIPAPGPSERMTSPTARIVSYYLINEFHLKINPAMNSLWQIAENPPSIRILRNVAIFLSMTCLFLILLFLLTVWATNRWISRLLLPNQKRAIMNEILDDATRLMLTARMRATVNKEKLFPVVLREGRRLVHADEHVKEVLKDQSMELHPSINMRMSRLGKLSQMAFSVMRVGKSFYMRTSQPKATHSPQRSMFQRFSRISKVEDDDYKSRFSSYTSISPDSPQDSERKRSSNFSGLGSIKGISSLKLLISSRKDFPRAGSDEVPNHLNINASPKGSPAAKLKDSKSLVKPRQSFFSMRKPSFRWISLTRRHQVSQPKEPTQKQTETRKQVQSHQQLKPQRAFQSKERQAGRLKQQIASQRRRMSAGRPKTLMFKTQQSRLLSPQRPRLQSPKPSQPHSPQRPQPHSPQRPRIVSPNRPQPHSPQRPRLLSPKPSQPHSPQRPQPRSPQRPQPRSPQRPRILSTNRPQPHSPQRPGPNSPQRPQLHSPQRLRLRSPQRPRLQSPKRPQQQS